MARSYRRNGARWENPNSPLQAARFARRWIGQVVCDRVQAICPGHGRGPCKLDIAKLSDWERGARPPSVVHIQALCEVFQASAEDLGLITWRKNPEPEPDAPPDETGDPKPETGDPSPASRECCDRCRDLDPGQLVLDWVRENAVAVLAEAFQALCQQYSQLQPAQPPQD